MNKDFSTQLYQIWTPQFSSIWRIENRFFQVVAFAKEKDPKAVHPGLVIDETGSNDSYQTAPGTSRYHSDHIDVFKTQLKNQSENYDNAYFLLHLSVPIHKKTFSQVCHRGWWNQDCLHKQDTARLKHQLSTRKSYDIY